ncbi:hypothetical protein [Acidipropionibacterium jensenii]|uniref:hypothetical protein n=1 Tax=Acidipropionibacterium jensenii TaxID=1749 RepID=UPI00214B2862|nr:hypothetical protein [Acidipropionibacterium jensenii]
MSDSENPGDGREDAGTVNGPQIDADELLEALEAPEPGSFEYYRAEHPEAGPRLWRFLADAYRDNGGRSEMSLDEVQAATPGAQVNRARRMIAAELGRTFQFEQR